MTADPDATPTRRPERRRPRRRPDPARITVRGPELVFKYQPARLDPAAVDAIITRWRRQGWID